MNVKLFKILVVTFLVMSLLVEVDARKKKRREKSKHRKKNQSNRRNRVSVETTAAYTTHPATTEHGIFVEYQDAFNTGLTIEAITAEKTQPTERVSVNIGHTTEECDFAEIRQHLEGLIKNNVLSSQEISSIWTSKQSKYEKVQSINRILLQSGLPVIPSCKPPLQNVSIKVRRTISKTTASTLSYAVESTSVATAENEFEYGMYDDEYYGDYFSEEESTIEDKCSEAALKNKIGGYVLSGQIPSEKLTSLMTESLSLKKRMLLLNETLLDANLPPLPACETQPERSHEVVEDCDPNAVQAMLRQYISSGKLSLKEVSRLKSGSYSQQEKMRMINETLVAANLRPLQACRNTLQINEEAKAIGMNNAAGNCDEDFVKLHLQRYLALGKVSLDQIMPITTGSYSPDKKHRLLDEVLKNAGLPPLPSCRKVANPSHKDRQKSQKINQILEMMEAGYLPPDTLQKLARGEITEQWLRANLTQNRNYILSKFPDRIRTLIEEGKMPSDVEEAIFSGSMNKSSIMKMIMENDDVIIIFLPQKLSGILEGKPIPMEVKQLFLSGKNKSQIEEELLNNEELLQQIMSPSQYFFYKTLNNERNKQLYKVLNLVIMVSLAIVMIPFGCKLKAQKITEYGRQYRRIIVSCVMQFIMMPTLAFALTKLLSLDKYAAISLLICACCPSSNLANILGCILRSNSNLSVLLTSISSLLGLILMPFSIFFYSNVMCAKGKSVTIPFGSLFQNLMLLLLPILVGMAFQRFCRPCVKYIVLIASVLLAVSSITVAVLAGIVFGNDLFQYTPSSVLWGCALLPMMGYLFACMMFLNTKESSDYTKAVYAIILGQNVMLCSNVLKATFDPLLLGTNFFLPLVYLFFQVIEGLFFALANRVYNRRIRGKFTPPPTYSETKLPYEQSDESEAKVIESEEDKILLEDKVNGSMAPSSETGVSVV